MKPALGDLASVYACSTGHRLAVSFDAAGAVGSRIQDGEDCDVAIIQKPVLEALLQHEIIADGSIVTLARSGIAMAVLKGLPKPVIDSIEALIQFLSSPRAAPVFETKDMLPVA